MTDQEINKRIAEFRGWDFDPTEARDWESRGKWVKSPSGEMRFTRSIPDYCNDLNAIHEAEKGLMGTDAMELYANCIDLYYGCRATALQRSEALLHTIGQWEEEA